MPHYPPCLIQGWFRESLVWTSPSWPSNTISTTPKGNAFSFQIIHITLMIAYSCSFNLRLKWRIQGNIFGETWGNANLEADYFLTVLWAQQCFLVVFQMMASLPPPRPLLRRPWKWMSPGQHTPEPLPAGEDDGNAVSLCKAEGPSYHSTAAGEKLA